MALAVADLDADDDAIERGQRLLHLQPAQAAPTRRIRAVRVLHHQPFVIAGPRLGEYALQPIGRVDGHQV